MKFLLENVVMSKKWEAVLTNAIGVEPVKINSNLVSAQSRKRMYWTNIAEIAQPEDEGIFLRDILEDDVDEKYYLSQKAVEGIVNRANISLAKKIGSRSTVVFPERKANTLCVYHSSFERNLIIADNRGRDGKSIGITEASQGGMTLRRLTPVECSRLQTVPSWYEWVVSDTQIYRMCGNGWTVRVIEHILKNLFV